MPPGAQPAGPPGPGRWLLGLGLALTLSLAPAQPARAQDTALIKLAGQALVVDLALTPEARRQGLAGRERLAEDQGMLFLFPEAGRRSFWMAGMRMSIDIIWISGFTVVGLAPNMRPPAWGTRPAAAYSPDGVDKVLEVAAGWAARHGVKRGERVILPLDLPRPQY